MPQQESVSADGPLQLGWIPYFNLLPLKLELERTFGSSLQLKKGVPAQVNRWLSEGQVAIAPSSSICLLRHSHHEIALPLGIATTGPVASVYLGLYHEDAGLVEVIKSRQALLREFFRAAEKKLENGARRSADLVFKLASDLEPVDLSLLPPLHVTPASATSTMLARIFFRLWFGEAAYEARAANGHAARAAALSDRRPMELLIGDEALARRSQFRAIIDLGEAWRDVTDLPFVFAVWQQSRKALTPTWRQKILEAAEIAQARMRVEPSHYLPDMPATDSQGRSLDLAAYWRLIQYRLGPQHFKGLALYLALARHMLPEDTNHQGLINITRWEAMGQSYATM